jgi:MFS family permease
MMWVLTVIDRGASRDDQEPVRGFILPGAPASELIYFPRSSLCRTKVGTLLAVRRDNRLRVWQEGVMTDAPVAPPGVHLHRNVDYLFLVGAQALSITGREIESLVLPLLVLALTKSPFQVGLIAAVQSLPYLLLGLPAGALVDRWSRKRVMVVCDAIRAGAFISLPIGWLFGGLHLTQLYIVAAAAGSAFVFYNIAEVSVLPQIVDKIDLPRATSVNTVVEWIGESAGPAIGGLLTGLGRSTAVGAMFAYSVQAAMLAASLFLLTAIRRPLRTDKREGMSKPLSSEINEGIQWLMSHPHLRIMAFNAMALSLIFAPLSLAIIVLARETYHVRPAILGLMFSLGAIPGLASTIAAPWLMSRFPLGGTFVVLAAIWAMGLAGVAASTSMLTLTLAWLILPAVSGIQTVIGVSYRLGLIPPEMQGRVNSVFRLLAWGLNPLALAAGGLLIGLLGARQMLWLLTAAMSMTAVAVALSPLRSAK